MCIYELRAILLYRKAAMARAISVLSFPSRFFVFLSNHMRQYHLGLVRFHLGFPRKYRRPTPSLNTRGHTKQTIRHCETLPSRARHGAKHHNTAPEIRHTPRVFLLRTAQSPCLALGRAASSAKDAVILSTSALLNSIADFHELPPSEISTRRERAFSPKTFQTVFFT